MKDYNGTHTKPAISEPHKFWSFAQSADSAAERIEQAQSSETETIAQGEGVEVIADRAADRVRIMLQRSPMCKLSAN